MGVAVDELVDVHVGRIVRDRGLGVDRPVWQLGGARRQDEIRAVDTGFGEDEPELVVPVSPVAIVSAPAGGAMFGYGLVSPDTDYIKACPDLPVGLGEAPVAFWVSGER